ncbi:amino acid permease [Candidatus Woesearchaeota archaeon]|nr:amino acid permease [Candidatus Woesearchaeota archaeon]
MPEEIPRTKDDFRYVKSAEELLELQSAKETSGTELKKTLGFGIIFVLALNFIFDSSILYVPQYSVYFAGAASIISWILMAMIGIYVALCYAELISMFPTSGGTYEVSKISFGTLTSFMVGWITWLVGNIGLAISIPEGLQILVPYYTPLAYIFKAVLVIITVYFFSELAKRGKDIGSKIIFYFTLLILIEFIVIILPMFIDFPALTGEGRLTTAIIPQLYHPFFPAKDFFTNIGLILGSVFIVSTYAAGLSGVSYLSGEVKEPQKTLPKVFKWSTIIVAITSVIIAIASLGIIDRETLINSENYFHDIVLVTLGDYTPIIATIVLIFAGFIYFSEGLPWILSGPRLIFSVAKDKLFPTKYAQIDKEFGTPLHAIKFQRTVIIIFIAITYFLYIMSDAWELDVFYYLLSLFISLSILLVSITLIAIPVLRKKKPLAERPYKVPFGTWLPYVLVYLFILISVLWFIHEETRILVLGTTALLLLIGILMYGLLIIYFDPEVYIKFKKFIVGLYLLHDQLFLSDTVKQQMYDFLGELTSKKVLQYGCTSHDFTLELAKKVTPSGKVYATDLIDKTIERINYHIKKGNITHVHTIHDEHQVNRIHPHIPPVDAIISLGMLGHIQDLRKIAKEMNALLSEGGKIVFKEEVDLFRIMPTIGWIALPEKVVEIFAEEGIRINYVYKKRLFWTDLIVYGMKTKYDVPMV